MKSLRESGLARLLTDESTILIAHGYSVTAWQDSSTNQSTTSKTNKFKNQTPAIRLNGLLAVKYPKDGK